MLKSYFLISYRDLLCFLRSSRFFLSSSDCTTIAPFRVMAKSFGGVGPSDILDTLSFQKLFKSTGILIILTGKNGKFQKFSRIFQKSKYRFPRQPASAQLELRIYSKHQCQSSKFSISLKSTSDCKYLKINKSVKIFSLFKIYTCHYAIF